MAVCIVESAKARSRSRSVIQRITVSVRQKMTVGMADQTGASPADFAVWRQPSRMSAQSSTINATAATGGVAEELPQV